MIVDCDISVLRRSVGEHDTIVESQYRDDIVGVLEERSEEEAKHLIVVRTDDEVAYAMPMGQNATE